MDVLGLWRTPKTYWPKLIYIYWPFFELLVSAEFFPFVYWILPMKHVVHLCSALCLIIRTTVDASNQISELQPAKKKNWRKIWIAHSYRVTSSTEKKFIERWKTKGLSHFLTFDKRWDAWCDAKCVQCVINFFKARAAIVACFDISTN